MKQRKIYILLGGMMAMLASSGCSREQLDNIVSSAAEVQFGASSMWQTEPGTRTEYSGDKVQVGTAWKERINWVKTTDRIRIYSPQAYKMYDSNTHIADYYISSDPDPRDEKSQAKIACVDKNGLQWSNSSAHHYFYALYPAPGTKWKYDQSVSVPEASAKIEASGTAGAKITGFIPTVQEVKYHDETSPTRKEYEPNMNYAYMYAVKRNVTRGSSVSLSFQPLVTTLQFTIKASDANAANLTLTGFKLKSSTVNLYGSFTATFSESSDTPTISISATDTGKEVSVSIPNDDRKKLSTNDLIMVTVFTLPVELTNLTIEMTFLNSSNQTVYRTLDLKSKSGSTTSWITVPACHKAYINSLGVPGNVWDYYFSVTNPTDLAFGGGTSTSGGVTSYRQNTTTGTKEALSWSVEGYYNNEACTQSTSKPSWLTSITQSGSGSTSGANTVTIQYTSTPKTGGTSTTTSNTTLSKTTSIGSASSRKNLSNPSNMDSDVIAESANCYIVNQPGYYRIPLVMGNAIRNGSLNPTASTYTGANGTNQIYFPNWIGNQTGTPWIKDCGPKNNYPYIPSEASVIWQDYNGLVSDLSLSSDLKWLYFRVPNTAQGNAVIAITGSGFVMWEYHIWVTNYVPGQDKAVKATGTNSTTYNMMPLNLGWVGGNIVTTTYPATQRKVYVKLTQSGGRTAVMEVKQATLSVVKYTGGWCPFYQWGRKDPFWPKDSGLYGSQATIYAQTWVKPDYVWTFRYSDWSYVVNGTDIGHKYTLHGGVSSEHQGDWQSVSKCYNLWNATNTSAGEKTAAAKKTIYDPCPAGYCVPVSGAFDFDNNGAFGDYDEGWYIYTTSSQNETLYFPGKQLMTYEGVIRSVDGSFYWTADPGYSSTTDPHETAYNYRLTSTMHDPDWYHARSYAGYIRPIKDTNR